VSSPESCNSTRLFVVLLVDDEEPIRHLLQHVLERDGSFKTLTAQSGEEALAFSRQSTSKIDLLITDIDMGRMNGIELYKQLRKERPETAVLFISGKANGFRESLPDCPLLEKPFLPGAFLERVRKMLSN
jgi:two-component system, cell cycle sensor histidine kinase and response regulator CckA